MTVDRLLDELADGLRSSSVAIWFGAGVSIPSGLPSAADLASEILRNTSLTETEQQQVARFVPEKLPLERLLEVVIGTMDELARKKFFSLFDLGKPSPFHRFLARLVKSGMATTLCTTNFDTHLENALKQEGLSHPDDYDIWQDPATFVNIDWRQARVKLIKIHGSIQDPEQLGATVQRLAAPSGIQRVQDPVRRVFGDGPHALVLTLGYSFSDRFDISPAIQVAVQNGEGKRVLDFSYTSVGDLNYRVVASPRRPTAKHRPPQLPYMTGLASFEQIKGDSLELVRRLASSLNLGDLGSAGYSKDWQLFLNDFFADLDRRQSHIARDYLAGVCLTMISAHRQSVQYYQRVLDRVESTSDVRPRLLALQALAGALQEAGRTDEALAALRLAEPLAKDFQDGQFSDHVLGQLAILYNSQAQACAERGRHFGELALEVAKQGDEPLRLVSHFNSIATSWMRLGDFDAAREAYSQALVIVENSGDLYGRAGVYGNRASLDYIVGDYNASLESYDKALSTSQLAGDKVKVGIHTMNRANVYVKLGEREKAMAGFKEARNTLAAVLWPQHPILSLLDQHEAIARRRWQSQATPLPGEDAES